MEARNSTVVIRLPGDLGTSKLSGQQALRSTPRIDNGLAAGSDQLAS
jgi:hypothetical protein